VFTECSDVNHDGRFGQGGIAVLGWGSLIWDLDDLAPQVAGPWAMRAGPRLAMEFSRVSPKRRMGLVVALDPADGVPCPTHAIRSRRVGLAAAVADLAARERAPEALIGWAEAGGRWRSRLPEAGRAVADWCAATGWQAAVWTDLAPNFAAATGRRFSVAAGIAHLRGLAPADLAEARRYVRRAPCGTRTPLRRALAGDPWWRSLARPADGPPPASATAPFTKKP
jgi:hypothetical protein